MISTGERVSMRQARETVCLLVLLTALLAGCAGTRVDGGHPLLTDREPAATVYFIRPATERYMGMADNVITVEADAAPLVRLVKGEYTMARLRPGAVFLTVRNDTTWGNSHFIREMARSARFEFAPGETYFVVLQPFDGEFRGVHFQMAGVDLQRARELTRHMRGKGGARSAPIDRL